LVVSIVFFPHDYWLSFNIFTTGNIKNSTVLNIDELVVDILEDLPPS
jgi:hypothetical protein